jgi:fructose-1,6-bisphosphatase
LNVIGFTRIIDLDPQGATHAEAQFDSIVEGDALARLTLIFDLLPGGGSVNVNVNVNVNTLLRVYDDGTDQTDDYQETTLEPFV